MNAWKAVKWFVHIIDYIDQWNKQTIIPADIWSWYRRLINKINDIADYETEIQGGHCPVIIRPVLETQIDNGKEYKSVPGYIRQYKNRQERDGVINIRNQAFGSTVTVVQKIIKNS